MLVRPGENLSGIASLCACSHGQQGWCRSNLPFQPDTVEGPGTVLAPMRLQLRGQKPFAQPDPWHSPSNQANNPAATQKAPGATTRLTRRLRSCSHHSILSATYSIASNQQPSLAAR